MSDDFNKIYGALGRLEANVENLSKSFQSHKDETTAELRTIHDIVVAMSEAARNLTRRIEVVEPVAKEFHEGQLEQRGIKRFLVAIYTAAGGFVVFILGRVWDWYMARPHVPAIIIALLALAALTTAALARDDGRYAASPLKDWVNGLKDKNGQGCCDTSDGFPAEVEWDTEREHYRVRIDGAWHVVPPAAVLDQPNRLGYPMVWYWRLNGVPQIRCFIPGAGG